MDSIQYILLLVIALFVRPFFTPSGVLSSNLKYYIFRFLYISYVVTLLIKLEWYLFKIHFLHLKLGSEFLCGWQLANKEWETFASRLTQLLPDRVSAWSSHILIIFRHSETAQILKILHGRITWGLHLTKKNYWKTLHVSDSAQVWSGCKEDF